MTTIIIWILYIIVGVIMMGYEYKKYKVENEYNATTISIFTLFFWPFILLFDIGQNIRKHSEGN